MEELANKTADGPVHEPASKGNRGWFHPGDRRINRLGRPRGSKVAAQEVEPADLAPRTDRLKLLALPLPYLVFRLLHRDADPIANLPEDVEVIAGRVDPARGAVVFTLRSARFERVARGTPIPAFAPEQGQEGDARVFMPKRYADRFIRSMYARVPEDAVIVGCSWDDARQGVVFLVETGMIPDILSGQAIPEFRPH